MSPTRDDPRGTPTRDGPSRRGPGRRSFMALGAAMDKYGFDRGGARCGYPIGISYPPDWGERTMSLRPSDETILEPGMTFAPGKQMVHEENLVITEDGARLLSRRAPAELPVILG